MDGRRPRAELVPNANNPRLLLRLVGFLATGIRRPGALAEVLEVEQRTVHYYTQAAEWLGLIEGEAELLLTPRGLALAYSEPDEQRQVYAEAVWSNPLAAAVMGSARPEAGDELPPTSVVAEIIRSREPTMSVSTARRRATAVRGLLAPALHLRPSPKAPRGDQLGLPFPQARQAAPATPVDPRAGADESPDVYRRVLLHLLDHGELSTGQLRGVLDSMGMREAALGAYVEMASRRGDAIRIEERLVATVGATRRRDVAEDPVLIALTDPLYREYLDGLQEGAAALLRTKEGTATPADVELRNRIARLASRFAPWDLRIFGRRLQPGEVEAALDGLLLGRRLSGMPVAGSAGPPHAITEDPFVDAIEGLDPEGTALAICFPRTLVLAGGGVGPLNQRLRSDRAAPAGVRLPGPVDVRARVHGGLLAPGESLPRAIPDNLSLRLRALTHTPALSLLGALLLAGRRGGGRPVLHSSGPRDLPVVSFRRKELGTLVDVLARFATSQGWTVIRPPLDGLGDAELLQLAHDLGIATRAAGRALLDEPLFARLQEDPECRLVYEALQPLEDRLMSWIAAP